MPDCLLSDLQSNPNPLYGRVLATSWALSVVNTVYNAVQYCERVTVALKPLVEGIKKLEEKESPPNPRSRGRSASDETSLSLTSVFRLLICYFVVVPRNTNKSTPAAESSRPHGEGEALKRALLASNFLAFLARKVVPFSFFLLIFFDFGGAEDEVDHVPAADVVDHVPWRTGPSWKFFLQELSNFAKTSNVSGEDGGGGWTRSLNTVGDFLDYFILAEINWWNWFLHCVGATIAFLSGLVIALL